MNGVHYRTGNNTKKMLNGNEDKSGRMDNVVFAVGMIVTVRHGVGDNDAQTIEYRDNLSGPINAATASGPDNVIVVLGHTIIVENAALFNSLKENVVVEVSGFADNAGRIRAEFVSPASHPANVFEAKGFVSGLSLSGSSFRLGPLPGDSGATVAVSYGAAAISGLPGGPEEGMYVQVSTGDRVAAGGIINATGIVKLAARTEFPDRAAVDLEGLVTAPPSGSGKVLSFDVEGKRIRTDDATDFTGHSPAEIQPNTKLLVQGTETGGVLSAARIIFR
jgi:hypothetical protein